MSLLDERCVKRVTAGASVGAAVGGAVGACCAAFGAALRRAAARSRARDAAGAVYGTYDAFRAKARPARDAAARRSGQPYAPPCTLPAAARRIAAAPATRRATRATTVHPTRR
jgi:hypothetical protein